MIDRSNTLGFFRTDPAQVPEAAARDTLCGPSVSLTAFDALLQCLGEWDS